MPTEKGLVFETEETDNRGNNIAISQLDESEILKTRNFYYDKAEKYMSSVINILKSSPDDYPLFFQHAGISPAEDQVIRRNNNNKKTLGRIKGEKK